MNNFTSSGGKDMAKMNLPGNPLKISNQLKMMAGMKLLNTARGRLKKEKKGV